MMKRVEAYMDWLSEIAGDDGKIYDIGGSEVSPQLFVVKFDGLPEEGYSTAYSYGLSSVDHKEWTHSKPELLISVNTFDPAWALAMGEVIRQKRESSLFEYGSVIDFNEQIAEGSRMSAFVVFANALYDKGDEHLALPNETIGLSQLYPIFQEEISAIMDMGIETFMLESGIDFFDVSRFPFKG